MRIISYDWRFPPLRVINTSVAAGRDTARAAMCAVILLVVTFAGLSSTALAADAVNAAKVPNRWDNIALEPDYRIGPDDVLDIVVFRTDSLNRTVHVSGSGEIVMPLIGMVPAASKTASELADDIAARLGEKYLQAPQVSVLVKSSASRRFTVEGAVRDPGMFEMSGHITLLQAIAQAKGVDEGARTREVVLFRMVDEKRHAAVINLVDVRTGKIDDPPIKAGDVIVVPSSGSRRLLRDIVGASPLLLLLGL